MVLGPFALVLCCMGNKLFLINGGFYPKQLTQGQIFRLHYKRDDSEGLNTALHSSDYQELKVQ